MKRGSGRASVPGPGATTRAGGPGPASARSALASVAFAATALGLVATALPAVATGPGGAAPMPARVAFLPSDAPFANPERGFYGDVDLLARPLDAIAGHVAAGRTLVRAYVRLDRFVDADLDAAFLQQLDEGFAAVRRAGAKAIPRFTYNFPRDLDDPAQTRDATLDRALRHIRQLEPLLRRHADVIAYLEAGFVGAWGEWHSSRSGLDRADARRAIRDALLAALPSDRRVLFRYPADLRGWYPELGEAAARRNAGAPRVGLHNDCFLSSRTDAGTYPLHQPGLRDWTRRAAADLPVGGETCDIAPARGSCEDILREGRQYAVTYLNDAFYRPAFHERWIAEGCMAEVARSLGHRIRLESLEAPRALARGDRLRVTLGLRNLGWSRVHNPRGVTLRLVDRRTGAGIDLPVGGVDPRDWRPSSDDGSPLQVVLEVALPHALLPGDYELGIGLPDASATLARDPRYAIRPANADAPARGQRWDAATGAFMTGATLTVRAPR